MTRIEHFTARGMTMLILIGAFSFALAAPLATFGMGQDSKQAPSGQTSDGAANVPETAKQHRDLAAQYQQKAAEYRQEADAHRKMLADYKKTVARNPKAAGEDPYIKKMRLHCEKYIKAAEDLARQADEMAEFHLMRAKELEGE